MKLVWIRHGETEDNRLRRYLGHGDPPLNDQGLAQAALLRDLLADVVPAAVYSSDLTRCMQTASLIARQWDMIPVPVADLREISFGQWEGKTYEEIMLADGDRATKWYENPYEVAPPGGETLNEVGRRVDNWLERLLRASDRGDTVLIVSHGGVIRWFQYAWLARKEKGFWQSEGLTHGSALVAEWDGRSWKEHRL